MIKQQHTEPVKVSRLARHVLGYSTVADGSFGSMDFGFARIAGTYHVRMRVHQCPSRRSDACLPAVRFYGHQARYQLLRAGDRLIR
jgi:hypothetical protein